MKTQIDDEVEAVEICKQFGWTYEDYLNAPQWFLEVVRTRNIVEARFMKKQERKVKRSRKK